jgi:hypothetical protein
MWKPTLCIWRGLLWACESSEQIRMQRKSVLTASTAIIAFDQHAAATVAAVSVREQRHRCSTR